MKYIQINPLDNVAVALENLNPGDILQVNGRSVCVAEEIPRGHKVALTDLSAGSEVIKYGFSIGNMTEGVKEGCLVNERNLHTSLSGLSEYEYKPCIAEIEKNECYRTFNGFRRSNGSVGIRNEMWIVPTVGCVNGIAERLASAMREETKCEGIDAIVAYTHNYGGSQLGDDHENTRNILRNLVKHPNAGAVLVVGLGCENNQPSVFKEILEDYDSSRIRFLVCQEEDDEEQRGMEMLREMYAIMRKDARTSIPLSELRIGLKCGGSDGFSGITANPLLGRFSDYLVSCGGTTVLTEVPEMFGAETILMNRCVSREVFNKTVALINNFKSYFIANKQPIYENPSPGNKAGGISTLEEKSLGCTQKSGSSAVCDVLKYGETLCEKGLNLLSAPGNDLVASTALAAAGCHIVLFTTGRGTPFGTFVPTVKVSTNSDLYNRKRQWIDFNAGVLVEGVSMDELLNDFIDMLVSVASGEKVLNEKNDYRGIAIFKTGVTL